MKNFIAFTLSFFMLLIIASVATSDQNVNPTIVLGVVAIGAAVAVVAVKKKKGYAYGSITVSPFDVSQLQIRDIVNEAVKLHYGGRELPVLPEKLRIKRLDLHHIQYLTPTERAFKFFDKVSSTDQFSNFTPQLEGTKMQIIFGIQGELATGAAAADTADILAFGAAAAGDEEFINSTIEWEINKEKEIEPQMYKSLFVNDDGVKNYLRLPRAIVWEPQNSQILRVNLAKAYAAGTHKFAKMTLIGLEISK